MACKYYANEQFKRLKKDNQDINISLLHWNISTLPYHKDNLTNLLDASDFKFKMIAITESRLTTRNRSKKPKWNTKLVYRTHTNKIGKSWCSTLYLKKLNYKNRKDLTINKDEMLESVFVEVLSQSNKNTIIECIYKYPKMALADITQNFIQPLLDKLSLENKNIILLGDFNIDLLHHENEYF